jgi:hypothetical protein
VVEAQTSAECYRRLIGHLAGMKPKPIETAVLPDGVHPEDRRGAVVGKDLADIG